MALHDHLALPGLDDVLDDNQHRRRDWYPTMASQVEALQTASKATFAYSQPDNSTVTTSGGGSVTFGDSGADVNPGATAGDTAALSALGVGDGGVADTYIIDMACSFGQTTWADEANIGALGHAGIDEAGGGDAYLDLTSMEWVQKATRKAMSGVHKGVNRFTIVNRNSEGRVEFYHDGQLDATINNSAGLYEGPSVNMSSNGNSDQVTLMRLGVWEVYG